MNHDPYAKGMVVSGDEHLDLTPRLDLFQYRMVKPHLGVGKDILEVGAGAGYGRIAQLVIQDGVSPHSYVISEPSDHFTDLMERFLPVPVGINLTFVLRKVGE